MGALSIEKVDHLLWLGRYMERSYTTQRFIIATYDRALDSVEGNWKGQLEELGFDAQTETPREFFRSCLFDAAIAESVAHSMDGAYDNAVRLRDVLGPGHRDPKLHPDGLRCPGRGQALGRPPA